jgi:hypothetical protein
VHIEPGFSRALAALGWLLGEARAAHHVHTSFLGGASTARNPDPGRWTEAGVLRGCPLSTLLARWRALHDCDEDKKHFLSDAVASAAASGVRAARRRVERDAAEGFVAMAHFAWWFHDSCAGDGAAWEAGRDAAAAVEAAGSLSALPCRDASFYDELRRCALSAGHAEAQWWEAAQTLQGCCTVAGGAPVLVTATAAAAKTEQRRREFDAMLASAAQGLTGAMSNLSSWMLAGHAGCPGGGRQLGQGRAWAELAAARGDAPALVNLAFCHFYGWGAAENRAEAARCLRRAAEAAGWSDLRVREAAEAAAAAWGLDG